MTTRLGALACVVILNSLACRDQPLEVGFWFESVGFDSPRVGGALSPEDLRVIETVARREIASAFAGLQIALTDRRTARYRINVVQELYDPRIARPVGAAGQSRAVDGFGGWGSVSFYFIASAAVAYAPAAADRAAIVAAIGRGIGRTAVHEITHQLLPLAPIHDSTNVRSYEYGSAARREQYWGAAEWDLARPLLEKRVGLSSMFRGETNGSRSQ